MYMLYAGAEALQEEGLYFQGLKEVLLFLFADMNAKGCFS